MIDGFLSLPWWGYLLSGLAMTHVTIASVTIYLHRHQAHLALDLHPLMGHFFRFWLWLTTGMVTREWVAVHRKHHAKVEGPEDPHSPRRFGIQRVLWLGALLYRKEAGNRETLERYGFHTPNDWLEKRVYSAYPWLGITLMLLLDVIAFGLMAGSGIWLMQMLWIPFWAAGVINGVGHYWGYRNFEVGDTSTNIVPWGLIIGGEELHNNHHAFASSARFSNKPWEFDLGWAYIKLMSWLGLATVKKTTPTLVRDESKQSCDLETVKAVITSRFLVMANFAREVVNSVYREEVHKLSRTDKNAWATLKRAKRLLTRETGLLDENARHTLHRALDLNQRLQTVYTMREKLQGVWQRSATTQEHLIQALEEWCRQAEASGIQALKEFSRSLRGYALAPTPA
jgi:stearoyl-CoA desaturase (delta-9 desaturase)